MFLPYLQSGAQVLDIGSGSGMITGILRDSGFHVDAVDIMEGQYDPSVKPIVYDGETLPFGNKDYDASLLLTVLHHTRDPEKILHEAIRVSKMIVLMEDIYSGSVSKYYTFFLDTMINLWYATCPHTNRHDAGWRETFSRLGMKLIAVKYRNVIGVTQATYVLDCG